jgi:hypothetical protein
MDSVTRIGIDGTDPVQPITFNNERADGFRANLKMSLEAAEQLASELGRFVHLYREAATDTELFR